MARRREREPHVVRLLRIVIAVRGRLARNANELAALCEVSRRTIFRDIQALNDAGIAIAYNPQLARYCLVNEPSWSAPPLTDHELQALAAAVVLLDDEGAGGLAGPARSALGKLVGQLSGRQRTDVEGFLDRIGPASRRESRGPRGAIWEGLCDALWYGRDVRVLYRECPKGGLVQTRLDGISLERVEGEWVVVGRSSLHRRVIRIGLVVVEELLPLEPVGPLNPSRPEDRKPASPPPRSPRSAVAAVDSGGEIAKLNAVITEGA